MSEFSPEFGYDADNYKAASQLSAADLARYLQQGYTTDANGMWAATTTVPAETIDPGIEKPVALYNQLGSQALDGFQNGAASLSNEFIGGFLLASVGAENVDKITHHQSAQTQYALAV